MAEGADLSALAMVLIAPVQSDPVAPIAGVISAGVEDEPVRISSPAPPEARGFNTVLAGVVASREVIEPAAEAEPLELSVPTTAQPLAPVPILDGLESLVVTRRAPPTSPPDSGNPLPPPGNPLPPSGPPLADLPDAVGERSLAVLTSAPLMAPPASLMTPPARSRSEAPAASAAPPAGPMPIDGGDVAKHPFVLEPVLTGFGDVSTLADDENDTPSRGNPRLAQALLNIAESGTARPHVGSAIAAAPRSGFADMLEMPLAAADGARLSEPLAQRILWMNQHDLPTAQLRLNPPHLGVIEVHLSVNQDQASVSFTAQDPQVRQALEAALPRLEQMLAESGLELADADVSEGRREPAPLESRLEAAERGEVSATGALPVVAGLTEGLIDTYA